MNNGPIGFWVQLVYSIFFAVIILTYVGAGLYSSSKKRLKRWPFHRYVFWVLGVVCAATAIVGPVAMRAHSDFVAHMLGHLLLGMMAPLFLVLSAPMTLLLRTLSVAKARIISKILKSWPVRLISNPIFSSMLNIGGLWILYTTNLYAGMIDNILLHIVVHLHVFLAGYVFTASMIYIDPIAHRYSFVFRSIVFIVALAGHQVLSKYIYAYPPSGVPVVQAEIGGMLMYYGGDTVDIIIIFILCFQWFKVTRPQSTIAQSQST